MDQPFSRHDHDEAGIRSGGCLCGAIRYRLDSEPVDAGYCHCRLCQRFSGAPVMAFASLPLADVHFEGEMPARYQSSSIGERWFCQQCGSSIAMWLSYAPDSLDIAMATLDDPTMLPPGFHVWRESRVGWFDTIDALPRHERARPETLRRFPALAEEDLAGG